jgi:prepilin-type N-terminal cleavage/methylation domain-containing protein
MRFREQGITLVELMIAVALMGVGIMAAIGSYKGIQQSIQFSKGRTLATNIAQEKIQVLMQKSYYEVLVTTYHV